MEKDQIERLCEAYYKFNLGEWDEIAGEKPDGFDDLPMFSKRRECRQDYIVPIMKNIRNIVGEAELSRYHHTHHFSKTDDEWLEWYLITEHS